MSEELKPCPFCGGEAELREYRRWLDFPKEMVDGYEVICVNRDCIIYHADDVWFKTEAEAVEAWNTRAERTCTFSDNWDDPDVPLPTCSECGWEAEETDCSCVIGGPMFSYNGKFCKECGAKVVEQ